jgi:hypothetical protein
MFTWITATSRLPAVGAAVGHVIVGDALVVVFFVDWISVTATG